jgi:ABC-type multidrug transport system ATPase subunit
MDKIIELKDIVFSALDGRKIIQGVSVDFQPGIATAIVGPSGGGKSTVLKLSAGLLLPNHGEVLYKGKNIAYMSRNETLEFRREGAFVFQDSALWANMELFQILELPLKIHYPHMNRKQRIDRIKEVAAQAGYNKALTVRPSTLSMGEQKLIAFARAMLCNPSVLFLDEWTESLDENAAGRLINLVRKKKKENATILFVSHDMHMIMDLADFIVIVADGKITKSAPKDKIKSELLHHDIAETGIKP